MGFEAGFSIVKRAPNCRFNEMISARRRADFESTQYIYDYCNQDDIVEVSDDLVKFYIENKLINIDNWCSMAKYFDNDIRSLLKQINFNYYEVDEHSLNKLLEYAQQKVDDFEIVPVTITHGIKLLDNDKDEAEVKLIHLDGVQIQLEDGSIRQLYNEYDYGQIFVSKSQADIEQIELFKSLFNCINKLKQYDLNEYFIYYWVSY